MPTAPVRRSAGRWVALLFAVFACSDGIDALPPSDGGGTGGNGAGPGACRIGDQVFPSGTRNIPAPDGCNTCSCENGSLACTLIGCIGDAGPGPMGSGGTGGRAIDAGASKSCGSRGLGPCPSGEACFFPVSAQCGAADAPGFCARPPTACDLLLAPVCGCDGKTYGNTCTAAAARVSVAHEGECGSMQARACVVDGVRFPHGSRVPGPLGCNTCTCDNGRVDACTERACPEGMCVVDGKQFQDGEAMPDPESCNTCQCSMGMVGACTKKACPLGKSCTFQGMHIRNGSKVALGSLSCECQQGMLACQ